MGPEQAGSEDCTASPMHRAATAGQEKIGLQIAPHIRLTEHGARERASTCEHEDPIFARGPYRVPRMSPFVMEIWKEMALPPRSTLGTSKNNNGSARGTSKNNLMEPFEH